MEPLLILAVVVPGLSVITWTYLKLFGLIEASEERMKHEEYS